MGYDEHLLFFIFVKLTVKVANFLLFFFPFFAEKKWQLLHGVNLSLLSPNELWDKKYNR